MNSALDHYIVFSYDEDEYIPAFLGFGHGLKEKNICKCTSTIVSESLLRYTVLKKTIFNKKEIAITLVIGNENSKFISGFLTIDNKKYPILQYAMYASLQIDTYCYDNISAIRVSHNIFE